MDYRYHSKRHDQKSTKYREAKRKVEAKKEFYQHVTVFAVMSAFFFALNVVTAPYAMWFYWPILGWGIGVMFHYFEVFGFPSIPQMSAEWEDEQIREEMKRLDQKSHSANGDDSYEELELKELRKEKPRWKDEDLV